MRILKLFFLFIPSVSFAQNSKDSIKYVYVGDRDLTSWMYIFYNNGTYVSDITGHLGNEGKTKGTYLISKDTIILKPLGKEQQSNPYYENEDQKFILDGNMYIIDLRSNYDFRKLHAGKNDFYVSKKRKLKPVKKQ